MHERTRLFKYFFLVVVVVVVGFIVNNGILVS